jgi:UPF0755 protein
VTRRLRRSAGAAALIAAGLAILLVLAAVWSFEGPGPKAREGVSTTVMLPRGAGVRQIGESLQGAGVISSSTLFAVAARLTGAASHLKAGEYAIRSGETMAQILDDLRAGRVVRHLISVPEGWTSGMALDAVNASDVLVGTAAEPPEGSILPDTYEVQRGEDRAAVIARMQAARDKLLAQLWAARAPGLPLRTPEEAVTLASIVEKETGVPAERPRVAAIFINRLRAGMALQSDPTIIYSLTKGRPLGRGIRASELAKVTPYNSYKVAGLPPTPIANPGKASLEAVLNPPKTDELYFVANGTGGHAFAATLEEHARNVAKWREIEKQRAAGGGK